MQHATSALMRRIEAALRLAGRPLTRAELRGGVGVGPGEAKAFYDLQGRLPFIEVDSRRWGLVGRDLPGGLAAFEQAADALARAGCKTPGAACGVVSALSDVHSLWTAEMTCSAYRTMKLRALAGPSAAGASRLRAGTARGAT